MRIAKRLSLVLVAVCAFSAMAVSSASAALPRFLVHTPGSLLAKTLTIQTFTTAAGKVICEAVKLLNTATGSALVQESLHATVDYEKCTAFGLKANVTPVLYLFHANQTVDLLNEVSITAIGCEVKVFPKNALGPLLYRNLQGAISITSHTVGIDSEGKGVACPYAREQNGTYVGVTDVWLHSGSPIIWHAS